MNSSEAPTYSCIIPAKDEASSLDSLLPRLQTCLPDGSELIVVNDGSEDNTAGIAEKHGARVITHKYSKGNGAAIKTGARNAEGKILIFLDADGQHRPEDIPALIEEYNNGNDMVVAARSSESQASKARWAANSFYNLFASFMVNRPVKDLTSGFRVVNAEKFRKFIYLLPNSFSYPTTITMAFFRAGFTVSYVQVNMDKREGKSHVKPLRDGFRFTLIIFKIGTLYSPLKIFLPLSVLHFLTGLCYYLYTYINFERLTNMTVILIVTAILIFLIGLVSEQITALVYKESE